MMNHMSCRYLLEKIEGEEKARGREKEGGLNRFFQKSAKTKSVLK